jgi:PAS domain S-box-containing protein
VLYIDRRTGASELLVGFGTWEWDIAAERLAWSPHLYDVFGVTPRLFTPTFEGCLAMVHPDDRAEVERTVTEALATGAPFELTHRVRSDGVTRWMTAHGRLLMNGAGKPAVMFGTVMDVTRVHAIAEEMERRAAVERVIFEHMSDLVIECDAEGRVIAMNRAMQAATGHGPLATDDRPHFTEVLRYGTVEGGAGEEDGRPLARALRGELVVDSEETFVNVHGDKMVLVVSSCGFRHGDGARLGAVAIARDVTDCIGVTVSHDRSEAAQGLADPEAIAASRAKERGPGEIEVFRRDGGTVDGADRRGDALQRALENGEFFFEYQPKLSLSSGRTTGVEALLRWNDPERGRVAPLDFIPLAEATGQIKPIGAWVLRTACEAAMRWATCFPELGELVVAVNVSSRQFDDTLAAVVDDALTATGLDPKLLCLEITESAVMENADAAIVTLQHIKALGVRISIDDFGTGYSSLAYLRRFPIDELKIDRTFVDGLGTDPEATAIVAAIMGMAHALGLSTVAEGVETELQERALRNLGCDETQGYLRCRPVAGPDLEMFLTQGAHGGDDRPVVTVPTAVVIDDLGEVRQLVRASLSSAGFIVHEADRGDDGLELVRRLRPDCVLLDVNMPGKSGLEVCRILRADSLTSGTTIIMLTTDNRSGDKVAAYVMDADDYIVKPFAPRDLVARVNMAIRRRRSGL